jgi:ActR/RegA family two-component response regulator
MPALSNSTKESIAAWPYLREARGHAVADQLFRPAPGHDWMKGELTRLLVVDDDKTFVKSLAAAFAVIEDWTASSCSDPASLFAWCKTEDFDFDVMLLDMRLGQFNDGESLNAAKLIPHLMTYCPELRIFVFSQQDITVDECLQCLRKGAKQILPKTTSAEDLVLLMTVHKLSHAEQAPSEALIKHLWESVNKELNDDRGSDLERLVINLFNSMPGFRVIKTNMLTPRGEIDALVRCTNLNDFWVKLDSQQIVIECKHRRGPSQVKDFNQLKELVRTRGLFSKAGIMMSMSGVSKGFKSLIDATRTGEGLYIYVIEKAHLQGLVKRSSEQREVYLREVLSKQ